MQQALVVLALGQLGEVVRRKSRVGQDRAVELPEGIVERGCGHGVLQSEGSRSRSRAIRVPRGRRTDSAVYGAAAVCCRGLLRLGGKNPQPSGAHPQSRRENLRAVASSPAILGTGEG